MASEGLGPEIAAAHVAITASFAGMAAQASKQAMKAGASFANGMSASASTGASKAGAAAGARFGSAFSEKVSAAFKNVFLYGGAYAAIGGIERVLGAAGHAIIGFNSTLEQANIGLTTITGSSAAAKRELAWIKTFDLKSTLFNYQDALQMDQALIGVTHDATLAHQILKAAGDAAAGLGRGKAGVESIDLALSQMLTKGKIQAQELQLQLAQVGINGVGILAQATGKTTAEISELMQKGLLDSKTYVPLLVRGIEAQFPDMQNKLTKSFGGMWENIQDELTMKLGQAGKGVFSDLEGEEAKFLNWLDSADFERDLNEMSMALDAVSKTTIGTAQAVHTLWPEIKLLGEAFIAYKTVSLATTAFGRFQIALAGARTGYGATIIAQKELQASTAAEAAAVRALSAAYQSETMTTAEVVAASNALTIATERVALAQENATLAAGSAGLRGATSGLLGVLGGPWGVALGAATFAVTSFVGQEISAKSATDDLTDHINSLSGALDKAGKRSLANTLLKSFDKDTLAQAGYSIDQAVTAIQSGGKAFTDLNAALEGTMGKGARFGSAFGSLIGVGPLGINGQIKSLKSIEDGYKNDAKAAKAASDANATYGKSAQSVIGSVTGLTAAQAAFGTQSAKTTALMGSVTSAMKKAHDAAGPLGEITTAIGNKFWAGNKDVTAFANALHIGDAQAGILGASLAKLPTKLTMEVVSNFDSQTLKALGLLSAVSEINAVANATANGQYVNLGEARTAQQAQKQVQDRLKSIQSQFGGLVGSIGSAATSSAIGGGSGGGSKSKPKYDPWKAFLKAFNAQKGVPNYMQASGRQVADFLIKGFGDELNKNGKLTTKGLEKLDIAKWSKGAVKQIKSDFADAAKDTKSKIADIKSSIKSAQDAIAQPWMSNIFGAQGSTDFFGNTIGGSTAAAAQALGNAQLKSATDALADYNKLKKAGTNADFLSSLISSGNFGELSDLSANTQLADTLASVWQQTNTAANKLADATFANSTQGKNQEAQLTTQQGILAQQQALVTIVATMAQLVQDEKIKNAKTRAKAEAADEAIINAALKTAGLSKTSLNKLLNPS